MKRFKKFILCTGLTAAGFTILFAPRNTSAEAGDVVTYKVISSKSTSHKSLLDTLRVRRNELKSKTTSVRKEEVKIESGGGEGEETQTLPEGTDSVIIKQGNGTVVVWTETPLPDINQYRSDYLSTPGRDPSIKEDDHFEPINGYGTFDMNATLNNPWKTYTFGVDPTTGKQYFSASGDAYSHINAQYTPPTATPALTPGDPKETPTNGTPTPTLPGQTPTPTLPGQTPTPTNYYPQTGDNSFNGSDGYGVLTILGVGAALGGWALIKKARKAKRGY